MTIMSHRGRGIPPPLIAAIDEVRPLSETIWSSLVGLQGERGNARIMFTGTDEASGNTLITSSTGLGIARNTRSEVLLVEAHLQRPAMAAHFGVDPVPGLSDLLVGQATFDEVSRRVQGCPGLSVVPGGTARHTIAGEFAAEGARELLAMVAARGRYVLFDAPPILRHSESRALLSHVDGVVLVLRARASKKAEARRAIDLIESAGVEVVGSVFNRFKSDMPFDPHE